MKTYSVSDASQMLNVNEETIRRWIRDGKLTAKRAVGRGGNTIFLEDIVVFANKPPRAYLLSLESWLDANGISYQKVEDPHEGASVDSKDNVVPVDEKKRTAAAMVPAVAALTAASSIIPFAGPLVTTAAVATAAATKRRKYQSHSIQLVDLDEETTASNEEVTETTCAKESCKDSTPDSFHEPEEEDQGDSFENEIDATHIEVQETTTNILEQIAHAKRLLDAEIITQEEFTAIKARLIEKI